MKNQYFGDNRDLFKYDLVERIVNKIDAIDHFTFVPMLTPNDSRADGNKIDHSKPKAGTGNTVLVNYLDCCIKTGRRNISEIKKHFSGNDIKITIYKEDQCFDHKKRKKYFEKINDNILQKSLILLDPDNGLEVKKSTGQHILYEEVKGLFNRMGEDSILMIYQHFPRENHEIYLKRRSLELEEKTGGMPIYISDNEIIFFLLTKDQDKQIQLSKIISKYSKVYKRLVVGNMP